MKKDKQKTEAIEKPQASQKQEIHPVEKEFDADTEVHKTSPDLIQKEDHHLPVDDEIKNG